MNLDIKELLRRAVGDQTSRLAFTALLDRARSRRRRKRLVAAGSLVAVALGAGLLAPGLLPGTPQVIQLAQQPRDQAGDSVRLSCGPAGISLSATAVAAQTDGVHLLADFDDGYFLGYMNADGSGGGLAPGRGLVVLPLRPGSVELTCASEAGEPDSIAPLTVIDSAGVWTTPDLACTVVTNTHDSIATAGSAKETAVRFFSQRGWRGDRVDNVGYVEAAEPTFGLWDGDRLVATAQMQAQEEGDYIISSASCQ